MDKKQNKNEVKSLVGPWYLVTLCMIAYVFSFVDRQILAMLIEPIRQDLQISDTQFSLIHGLSFAIFYAIMGLPIARLADRNSRPLIIAIGIATWSIATVICGMAKSFSQLFFARMGVGVGEAALSPAAYSMISDSFPKSKLGLALGVYSIGSFIGAGLAFIIGGVAIAWVESSIGVVEWPLIGVIKPWQMTFFIVGFPGVLIALLFLVTVKDPERKGIVKESEYSLRDIYSYIKTNKNAFIAHYIGFGFMSLVLFALLSWSPAFLLRNFDMSTSEMGLSLGCIVLVCNVLGVLCSGWLVDLLTKQGYFDAALIVGILGSIGVIVPVILFPFMGGVISTLLVLGIAFFFASFPLATSAAALQLMAPNQMRAQVTAIFFLFMNLIGITGGATLVALATDYLFKSEQAVGFSMALVASGAAVVAAVVMNYGREDYSKIVSQVNL